MQEVERLKRLVDLNVRNMFRENHVKFFGVGFSVKREFSIYLEGYMIEHLKPAGKPRPDFVLVKAFRRPAGTGQ